MEQSSLSTVATLLVEYVERRGPGGESEQDACRQLLALVVRTTGRTSIAELTREPGWRREIEEALARLSDEDPTARWLIGRLAGEHSGREPRSDGRLPQGRSLRQNVEGSGNVNLLVGESVFGGLTIGAPPQLSAPAPGAPPASAAAGDRRAEVAPIDEGEGDRADTGPRFQPSTASPGPDLELVIRLGLEPTGACLNLELSAKDPAWSLDRRTFGPLLLRRDPQSYTQELLKTIEKGTSKGEGEAALRALGADLARQLIGTKDLAALLWSLQHRVTTLLIRSEEPWIPWELVLLQDPEARDPGEGRFLCEAFAVSRWLDASAPVLDLPLRRIALVAPRSDEPIASNEEVAFLEGLQGSARSVCPIVPRLEPLIEALASGGYDGWHFSGHGLPPSGDPNLAAIPLDDRRVLTPRDLCAGAAALGRSHPLVFLNACHTGRAGFTLTSIGGWAQQFLGAGAGAFLGALWSIDGRQATEFAKAFYRQLVAGVPIAQAVRTARHAIRAGGDGTWLAYTLYAHPLASSGGRSGP